MKYIYVKLIQKWGGFQVDDVIRFGLTKGERIIEQGKGVKVKKQPAVNDPKPEPKKEPPVIETTMAELKVEKAVATPVTKPKEEVKEKSKEK
jgi:hypothetical protein